MSVVIPAFNEARNIERTLSSLMRQELARLEIIVVDDGSKDGTAELARACLAGFARSKVIRLPVNAGKANALNIGIAAAGGDLVATIDADTRLEQDALASARATILKTGAHAVAFYLDVDNRHAFLGLLQRQEYIASLNFERAGQAAIGAISVLPGAATLFRRDILVRHPFSARTRTEDADLTLSLSRRGLRLVLAEGAVASTVVPDTWRGLMTQRTRWIAGHLQCGLFHSIGAGRTTCLFRLVTFPNFLASTTSVLYGCAAAATILASGHTHMLNLGWADAVSVSLGLVYLQRASLWIVEKRGPLRLRHFLLEPLLTNLVSSVCFLAAVLFLSRSATRVLWLRCFGKSC
jgi:cellulose synthase/poly-beta-1,6-N-acetylglucosamine synthase-like glycosyltransferase